MKGLLYIAGLSLALGNMYPVQGEVIALGTPSSSDEVKEAQVVGQEFLKTASEMWFLLSGIGSKAEADKAAPRFSELVQLTFELDNKLSELPLVSPESECVGMMDNVQMRILETMDNINQEFLSLCRANCYESDLLRKAFGDAVKLGMFAESDVALLQEPIDPLSDEESRAEVSRIRHLLEPDQSVVRILSKVEDVESAAKAVQELLLLKQRFKSLVPPDFTARRAFTPGTAVAAKEAMAPIEPLLWAIRSEIVRIAALPGYEAETYDTFSDALDGVFESLNKTHCHLFESVFDASFRADLDNALQEDNNISSQ